MKKPELLQTLLNLRGNPRACVYTEPLWGIPYNLYIPFATLFMYRLGVDDTRIGILLSIGMVLQVITALFGGVLTDKWGRRVTTLVFDIISWSIPCLIWAFAQNFWWFLAATIISSMWQITVNSWNCLLVEDCDKKLLVNVYTWVHISGLIAVFFAPISTLLVDKFSLIPTVRGLYIFTFFSMTAKFIILFFMTKETKMGKIRMKETKHISFKTMFGQYGSIVKKILKRRDTVFLLTFLVLYNISDLITNNFFAIYITEELGIADSFLAIFPMIRAVIVLTFMLGFQSKLNAFPIKRVMGTGFVLFMSATTVLLLAPPESLVMIIIHILIQGLAFALVAPRRDSMIAWFVEEEDRARINSIIYICMLLFTSPFGYIVGALSSIQRTLPFVVLLLISFICLIMIIKSKVLDEHKIEMTETV